MRQRGIQRSQTATETAGIERDQQAKVTSPVLAEMAAAIVALREKRWSSAAALLEPLVAGCMDPRDRALAGFLLAYALATEGKPGDARERYLAARLTLERIAGAGDLGDRWVDIGLCALAAGFASRHIDGVEPPPRLDHQSLSGARERWQPVNEALEQVWMLARHRRWHEASSATEVTLRLPGFDWETAEVAIIRWPLKLAVIHAMAGDRKASRRGLG